MYFCSGLQFNQQIALIYSKVMSKNECKEIKDVSKIKEPGQTYDLTLLVIVFWFRALISSTKNPHQVQTNALK